MEKVTITRVFTKERTSKAGKPFTSLSIQTKEHGEKWIGGFKNKQTENWKEGDVVEIKITQSGEYLNFEVPKLEEKNAEMTEKLNREIIGMRLQLAKIEAILSVPGLSTEIEKYVKEYMLKVGLTQKADEYKDLPEYEDGDLDIPF